MGVFIVLIFLSLVRFLILLVLPSYSTKILWVQCRTHRVKILDYLHAIWDFDRKSEWSIWIIHSKIDIPHRYLRSMTDDSPRHGHLRRISSSRKVHLDVIIYF
jgi:hypothetical protein